MKERSRERSLRLLWVVTSFESPITEHAMQWHPRDVKLSDNKHAYCCTNFSFSLLFFPGSLLRRYGEINLLHKQVYLLLCWIYIYNDTYFFDSKRDINSFAIS